VTCVWLVVCALQLPSRCYNVRLQALGLGDVFVYEKMECDSAGAIVAAMQCDSSTRRAAVVGGSVTMPLKQAVMQLCRVLSPAAACIGCVNTLSVQQCGGRGEHHILGDNTDWAGMRECLSRAIRSCASTAPITCAVIVGSGATARSAAFALLHLPHITCTYICNRTPARAAALAAEFNVYSFGLEEEQAPPGMRGLGVVIISTVSATRHPHLHYATHCSTTIPLLSLYVYATAQPLLCASRCPLLPACACPPGSSPLLPCCSIALTRKLRVQCACSSKQQHARPLHRFVLPLVCCHQHLLPMSSMVSSSFSSKRSSRSNHTKNKILNFILNLPPSALCTLQCQIWTSCAQPPRAAMSAALLRCQNCCPLHTPLALQQRATHTAH
jgi:shikimate 5-dehydrogenase